MRLPVFSRDSNPAIDPFLCKKSAFYVESLIASGMALWVDSSDKSKGCIGIGMLRLRHEVDPMTLTAGSGYDTAWGIRPSGYAGPGVWQLKTSGAQNAVV